MPPVAHPQPGPKGETVWIERPHKARLRGWTDPEAALTITPGDALPVAELNGVRLQSWQGPRDPEAWQTVSGQRHIGEPELATAQPGHKLASGLVMREPDGRVWLVSPTNAYGGYHTTFPKGRLDAGLSAQANAIREAWEESGLKARIVAWLGDVDRTTTRTRYYLAQREAGTPSDMGWESQAVHLVPLAQARAFLASPYDRAVLDLLERFLSQQEAEFRHDDDERTESSDVEHQNRSRRARRLPRRITLSDRYEGCLLGGAVGDALGAPVEFMARAEIERRFGPQGLTDYAPAYGGIGRITDDTQMTLFTAEGLLRAEVRGRMRGLVSHRDVVCYAYLRWLRTQGETTAHGMEWALEHPGWLYPHRGLHARRAPGNTCLAALRSAEGVHNDSKGCGGVMRVAPVGLYTARAPHASVASSFELACELAGLTHGHPTGQLAAGAFAALVHVIACGGSLDEALDEVFGLLPRYPRHEETLTALQQARHLARAGEAPGRAIPRLGQGWVAEEALAIAVYCALQAHNFEEGVLLAIHHDGDSDSTGAMAGNLLGTMGGVQAIPERWLARLELRDVITELAQDLYDYPDWPIGEYVPETPQSRLIFAKYPGC
jgi:ADP-ribosylglycohydrolase/ADP-ribose pyrophosphatase YjhB (NUDIX family)